MTREREKVEAKQNPSPLSLATPCAFEQVQYVHVYMLVDNASDALLLDPIHIYNSYVSQTQ